MKMIIMCFLMLPVITILQAETLDAYLIYDTNNNEVRFNDMINNLKLVDVVFFGELHDNAIAHWLELEVITALGSEFGENMVLGAEMLEADNQMIIDEYSSDLIKTRHFEENMRLWPNYETDYKPLVEYAVQHNNLFVATNIPRRYAGLVARKGLSSLQELSAEAQQYIAPLPIEFDATLACYAKMNDMKGMPHAMQSNKLAEAQAVKDATMAYFISQNMKESGIFVHFNGRYHSDNKEGIVWYLGKYAPQAKVMTITTAESTDMQIPQEDTGTADYIIVVNSNMTSTYK